MQAVLWLLQLAARRHLLVAPRRCLLAVVLPAVVVLVSRVAKAVTREWAVCYSSAVVVVRRVAAAPLHLNLRRARKRAAYRSTLASRQRAAAAPCQYPQVIHLAIQRVASSSALDRVTWMLELRPRLWPDRRRRQGQMLLVEMHVSREVPHRLEWLL